MIRVKQSELRAWIALAQAEGLDVDVPLRSRIKRSREQQRVDLVSARAKATTPIARKVLTRALERFDRDEREHRPGPKGAPTRPAEDAPAQS